MRQSDTPVYYLVGTPRGRLTKLEKAFVGKPWEQARESVDVKLLEQADELYILARSTGRIHKERAMRQRKLKRLWNCPAYLILRDIFPQWAVDAGVFSKGLIYSYFIFYKPSQKYETVERHQKLILFRG